MKEKLFEILMADNVIESITNNLDILLTSIPEIKDMIGFEHNHPHHHLDVWNHTLLALSISEVDFDTRLVLLLHDIGKPHSYQDDEIRHFHNHAIVSANISTVILNRLGFTNEKIDEYAYLIREHDNPISNNEISENIKLATKKFKIQFCDALAHNPTKLSKRIKYLKSISEKLKIEDCSNIKKLLIYQNK